MTLRCKGARNACTRGIDAAHASYIYTWWNVPS
jgi:hypothetical protein